MTTQAERMVGAIVGGRKGDRNLGEDTSEEEDESERDSEEEDEYQEGSSEEESVEEGENKCSVCNSGGSTHGYKYCGVMLHELCAQSTTPFLCQYWMRKKRLREGEYELDVLSGREDSNNKAEQGNRDIIVVDSLSFLSGDSASEDEFKPATTLQAAPFLIGSQKGHNMRGKRILRRDIETTSDTPPGGRLLAPAPPLTRTLQSETKKDTKKE